MGPGREATANEVLLVLVAVLALVPSLAFAQETCPGLDAQATRFEQAQCWYTRQRTAHALCRPSDAGAGACITQASTWCAGAPSSDQHELNVCFLSHVGARRFDDAAAIVASIRDVTAEAASCHRAFTVGVGVRVIAASAEIVIDDQPFGSAPVETTLRAPWWQHRIVARFGRAPPVDVVRGSDALRAAFDAETCTMADLVIAAPSARAADEATERSSFPVFGVVMSSSGAAVAAAGVVLLLVAQSNVSDLGDDERDSEWSAAHQSRLDDIGSLRIGGGVALGVGLAAASVGVVALLAGSGTRPDRRARHRPHGWRLSSRSSGMELRWDF